jgi:hypothetical protein
MEPLGWLLNMLIRLLVRPFTRLDHRLQDWWRGRGTDSWPIAAGKLQARRIESQSADIWRVTVFYTYMADNKWWPGNTWRQFSLKKDAEKYAAGLQSGSQLMVRYSPLDAASSVVLARDQHLASAGSVWHDRLYCRFLV